VRFWDSSALVALCARDSHYEAANPLLRVDPEIVVWWGTLLECAAAFKKRVRSGEMSLGKELTAGERLSALAEGWLEVQPSEGLRASARRLLHRHVLRSGDALQLAAALEWTGEGPFGVEFVTFDRGLAKAALEEGFTVLPTPAL
jgi:predicted nucleic acid-binding protein